MVRKGETMIKMRPCRDCGGIGYVHYNSQNSAASRICPQCHGSGYVAEPDEAEHDAVLWRAIVTYGGHSQTLMVMEEMAELQKELCKRERGADNISAIAEEIADVQIMIAQMIMLYGCADAVEKIKHEKIDRLRRRLEGKNDGRKQDKTDT